MPVPSNVEITGCVLDGSFYLFKKHDAVFVGIEKYKLRSESPVSFSFDLYNGKLIRTNAASVNRQKRKIGLYNNTPKAEGACRPISVKGCVIDKTLFVTETHFGQMIIAHHLAKNESYRPKAIILLTDSQAPYNISSFEGKNVTINPVQVKMDDSGIKELILEHGSITATGPCIPSSSYALTMAIASHFETQAYEKSGKGQYRDAARALEASLPYVDPYAKCQDYKDFYTQQLQLGLSFESVKYGYLYARCSKQYNLLDDLEMKFTREKEISLAGLSLALACNLEKDGSKRNKQLKRLEKLEKSSQ
jgi:hypothetical protein